MRGRNVETAFPLSFRLRRVDRKVPLERFVDGLHSFHRPTQVYHQPSRVRYVNTVRREVRFVYAAHTKLCAFQSGFARQIPGYDHLLRVQIDSGSARRRPRRPPQDVPESATKLNEMLAGTQSGAHQQLAGTAIVDLADNPQPIVIASTGPSQQILIAGHHLDKNTRLLNHRMEFHC